MRDRIELHCGDDRAELSLHGGQLLHWRTGGCERLFMSPRAVFAEGKAIRGGVPVIFPQFAACGPGPRHGFARLRRWRIRSQAMDRVELGLDDDAATRAQWRHRFELRLHCALAPGACSLALEVRNLDARALAFTAALHAYFAGAIDAFELDGLQAAGFEEGGRMLPAEAAVLHPAPPLDRIYAGGADSLLLRCGERALAIERSGFSEWVVWNPGAQAAALADLGAAAAGDFLCVEPARALSPLTLEPGQGWRGELRMRARDRA
jgi:glucose-6-phosphate 1-epimerase